MRRYLYIVDNSGHTPSDRPKLLRELRSVLPVLNVRVASQHIELVLGDVDPEWGKERIETTLGSVRYIIDITNEERIGSGDIARFVQLFNEERFWEAHAELEPLWRKSRDGRLQGLIILAAAYVKLQEGAADKFVFLASEALKLLEGGRAIGCINIDALRESVERSLETRRPFKIICEHATLEPK